MTIENDICAAFCDGLSVRKVPLGYAIKTPFTWLHGEPLVVFVEEQDGLIRMRDSGDTLALLEDVAGDLSSQARVDAMQDIAFAHGITFDEENALFTSQWVDRSQLGNSAIRFMSFLNRLQDMALLSRERVGGVFREELAEAVMEHFGARYEVSVREPISPEHKEYTADILIRGAQVQAAIYAATAEVNVLEALLTEQVFSNYSGVRTIPFVIFEDYLNSKVSMSTRRRALNSARLQAADWSGGRDDVIGKIEQQIAA